MFCRVAEDLVLGILRPNYVCPTAMFVTVAPGAISLFSAEASFGSLVFVASHGGSNVWGRAEQYDGSKLAEDGQVVVVVVQVSFAACSCSLFLAVLLAT